MPAAMDYEPTNKTLRGAADEERRKRKSVHDLVLNYYEGRHQKPLDLLEDKVDDNVIINLCRVVVDRTVTFLSPAFPMLELPESRDSDEETWLNRAWAEAGGAMLLAEIAYNGALYGHCYARVLDNPEGNYPRVVNLNPANVITYWRADDYQRVAWHELLYDAGGRNYRQDVVNRDTFWEIIDYEKTTSAWKEVSRLKWESAIPPIISWKHIIKPNSHYGRSELEHLSLNDAINKIASDIARILRFHASPRTVATGVDNSQITATGIDNLWSIKNSEAKVFNLEMQSDLTASMNKLKFLHDAFLAESRVVVLGGSAEAFQRVTNLGVRMMYLDQIAKNEQLHGTYGRGIQWLSMAMQLVGGQTVQRPTVKWADPLPTDPKESISVQQIELAEKIVSKETIAKERGRDWALEQERMQEEASTPANMLDMLAMRGQRPGQGIAPEVAPNG